VNLSPITEEEEMIDTNAYVNNVLIPLVYASIGISILTAIVAAIKKIFR